MINRRIKINDLLSGFLLVFALIVFVIGLASMNTDWLFWAVITMWLCMLIKNLRRDSFTVLAFLISFFAFLIGALLVKHFDSSVALRFSSDDAMHHTLISLFIALAFVDLGTYIANKVKFKTSEIKFPGSGDITRIQKASKSVYIFTAAFAILISIEKCVYVILSGSYTSYYINFSSVLPSFFTRIADMSEFAFFIFLATMPEPRKNKIPFIIFFTTGVLGLLYGQRNQIVMAVIMLGVYFILYENFSGEKYSIIKRKYYFIAAIALPFGMVFLEYFMYARDSLDYSYKGVWESIKHMLISLGGSVNVIGQGYELKGLFPKGHFYSLGGIIDFITKNELLRPILGTKIYQGNTIEMALYGNSYGQTITYLGWGPTVYLAGRGMGSSFIAESYHDMGYIGIMLFSFIYGVILTSANSLKEEHYVKNAIVLISLYHIIYAPRDSAGAFITSYFNFSFIFTLIVIVFASKIVKSRQPNSVDTME